MLLLTAPLAAAGLWISIYFTGVYYGWLRPDAKWIPQVCRLDEKSCLSVLQTPHAKIFGIPNSVFGILAYSYVLFAGPFFPPLWAFALLTLAFGRSIYLSYTLVFVTKIPCPLCFTAHLINLLLFLLYAYRVFH